MLPSVLLSLSVIEAEPRAPIKRPRRGVADTAHEAAENGEKETNYASGDAGRVPIVPLFISHTWRRTSEYQRSCRNLFFVE